MEGKSSVLQGRRQRCRRISAQIQRTIIHGEEKKEEVILATLALRVHVDL